MPIIREGDRVFSADCHLPGRVERIYRASDGTPYYRVQFPPGSPFVGGDHTQDWAIFRLHELSLASPDSTQRVPRWKQRLRPCSTSAPETQDPS
jgi:hypothetical protein